MSETKWTSLHRRFNSKFVKPKPKKKGKGKKKGGGRARGLGALPYNGDVLHPGSLMVPNPGNYIDQQRVPVPQRNTDNETLNKILQAVKDVHSAFNIQNRPAKGKTGAEITQLGQERPRAAHVDMTQEQAISRGITDQEGRDPFTHKSSYLPKEEPYVDPNADTSVFDMNPLNDALGNLEGSRLRPAAMSVDPPLEQSRNSSTVPPKSKKPAAVEKPVAMDQSSEKPAAVEKPVAVDQGGGPTLNDIAGIPPNPSPPADPTPSLKIPVGDIVHKGTVEDFLIKTGADAATVATAREEAKTGSFSESTANTLLSALGHKQSHAQFQQHTVGTSVATNHAEVAVDHALQPAQPAVPVKRRSEPASNLPKKTKIPTSEELATAAQGTQTVEANTPVPMFDDDLPTPNDLPTLKKRWGVIGPKPKKPSQPQRYGDFANPESQFKFKPPESMAIDYQINPDARVRKPSEHVLGKYRAVDEHDIISNDTQIANDNYDQAVRFQD